VVVHCCDIEAADTGRWRAAGAPTRLVSGGGTVVRRGTGGR
jgi:hypothetical protein